MSEVEVGRCLQELRRSLHLSQANVARRAGMSPAKLSRIETCRLRPNSTTLQSLLGAMGFGADSCRLLDKLMERGYF